MKKVIYTPAEMILVNEYLPKFEVLEDKINNYYSQWIRHIITLMTGLLTVMVAFKSDTVETEFNHLLFSLTLISLGLSVSAGILLLYTEVDIQKQLLKFEKESLQSRKNGDTTYVHTKMIETKKVFVVSEYLFYIFSALSLILLITYGIFKN